MRRNLCLPILLVAATSIAVTAATLATTPARRAEMADPHRVVGNDSCVKCHADEVRTWSATPHARTFREMHRRPEAKQIAARLGLRSIKHDGRCVACHYTTKSTPADPAPHAIAGISCESCHGAAAGWVDLHADFGPGRTRETEDPAHRAQRLHRSIAAGMRNPLNPFTVAQSCLRCHTTQDEQLVNVGGHSVGSPDFEFVSWSQGTVRHNFLSGSANRVNSPAELRVMFVAGIIAEVEAGLRATSLATAKADYGINAATRTAKAITKLKSVAAKIDSPHVDRILADLTGVQLKLNNAAPLRAAADRVATHGTALGDTATGQTWTALDPFIPPPSRFK